MTKTEAKRYALEMIGNNAEIIIAEYEYLSYDDGSRMSYEDQDKVIAALDEICDKCLKQADKIKYKLLKKIQK
jgi:hypothetical protein